jgi:hypothetical protein
MILVRPWMNRNDWNTSLAENCALRSRAAAAENMNLPLELE